MVSTNLYERYARQIGSSPDLYQGKNKKSLKPPPSCVNGESTNTNANNVKCSNVSTFQRWEAINHCCETQLLPRSVFPCSFLVLRRVFIKFIKLENTRLCFLNLQGSSVWTFFFVGRCFEKIQPKNISYRILHIGWEVVPLPTHLHFFAAQSHHDEVRCVKTWHFPSPRNGKGPRVRVKRRPPIFSFECRWVSVVG